VSNLPRSDGGAPIVGKTRLSSILRRLKAAVVRTLPRALRGAENGRERPLTAREVALVKVTERRTREMLAEQAYVRYTSGVSSDAPMTNPKETN